MFGRKKCQYCKIEIDKDKAVSENVRVYGRSDTPKKHFCSEDHLEKYKEKIDRMLGGRKPGVRCGMCMR